MHPGRLNLANAWIPYGTCNAEIFNKPKGAVVVKEVINTL